jgi:uncharacterized delta-60 repeat protein
MIVAIRKNSRRPGVEPLEFRALLSSAGSLDPSFGGGYGSTTAPLTVPLVSGIEVQPKSVLATSDGHILVSGITTVYNPPFFPSSAITIAELNPDGTPDTSFGNNGVVQLPIAFGSTFEMAVQPNGQIIGAYELSGFSPSGNTYIAVRLNSNGSLDTTFGTNGIAEYPAGTTTPTADRLGSVSAVLLQSNNQIILAGTAQSGFSAVRLNSDGSLDTTYGQDGTATIFVQPTNAPAGDAVINTVTGAAIQANDQVVLMGNVVTEESVPGGIALENTEIGVIRLNTDGSLDTTYGGTAAAGFVLIPPDLSNPSTPGGNNSTAVAVLPTTGDVLVSGYQEETAELYRLNTDGTLDTSFGSGGLVVPPLNAPNGGGGFSLAIEPDGDILLTGSVTHISSAGATDRANLELLRLNPDGSADTTFGNTSTPGLLLTRLSTTGVGLTPAIQPVNGNILLAGVGTIPALTGLTYGFTVDSVLSETTPGPAALTPPPTPPADFTGLGYSDLAVYDPTNGSFIYQSAIKTSSYPSGTDNTDPRTFAFGTAGAGQTIPAVADYEGVGFSQFAAYLPASGVYAILPTATSPGLFMQFGVAGAGQTIPVPADYYGTGQADVAIYIPSQGAFAILAPGNANGEIVPFGTAGAGQSIPAPGDYYGTGQSDIAVYLAQVGAFAIQDPTGKTSGEIIPFGQAGLGNSIPVPGDYDGSGKTELAVYIPSLGAYFYRPADGGNDVMVPIGTANSGEIPVPGDYDGSGRTEAAIYDPKGGFIEYQPANGGPVVINHVGMANNGSIPVAAPAGSMPEFAAPGSGSGHNAIKPGFVSSATTTPVESVAITISHASAVPAGPTLASARVALSLVNQGDEDASALTP